MKDKPDLLESIISEIETTLNGGQFKDNENSIVELKDLSTGSEWTSLKETVCAFLNTVGGYIICGVRERNSVYSFPGFDRKNEGKLIELQSKFFKNDNDVFPNLSDNIILDYRTLMDKTLAIITVFPLSEDLKYVKFNEIYYERILTQDKVIPEAKLLRHREYKVELEYSKEISIIPNAKIEDLDIDKINQFIIKINTIGIKKETVKKDIEDAKDFLNRRYCINPKGEVTVLGILLFGKEPSQFLENRARVDCYYKPGNATGYDMQVDISKDKKYLDSDIFNLMDDAYSFVWGHIRVGRSSISGGRSEPEFPEKLIREVINNALAHRDYITNKFITVNINPSESIEVKNPGSFKQKMLLTETKTNSEIRRIIPGVPESKNPKLANILKAFDKIESQGIGMATLVSACLDNLIDVPYYDLSIPDTISLVIPSGKLLDDETLRWLNSFKSYINEKLNGKSTIYHELVLAYLLKSERLNQKRLYTILLSPSNNHLNVLNDLRQSYLISEHPMASTEQTPVFILNKELTNTDFIKNIEKQVGKDISGFDDMHKKVLNIVYRYNQFNNQPIRPNLITPELYFTLYGKELQPAKYESLGRKVRKICVDLLNAGILNKRLDKSYEIHKI
ncbi:MAG: RNA-binding domain-containing protein [Bacteroidota bacterium]